MSIFSAIGSFISGIFKPASDLVDNLHVSDEERGKLRNELAAIQEKANAKLVELEVARLDALSKVQVAEAGSKYMITAIWRPVCSLLLVGLIIAGSFGWVELKSEIYELSGLFLGIYGGGRSAEKAIGKVADVVKLGRG